MATDECNGTGNGTGNGGEMVMKASPRTRKRRLQVGDSNPGVISREGESTKILSSPATPHGTPILDRVGHLEEQMFTLEQKYSPGTLVAVQSPTTPSTLERRRCQLAKSVLQETEAKGTILERVQMLERRLTQHSMALEQAFSSGRRMEPNLALESSPHQDNHEVQYTESSAIEKPTKEATSGELNGRLAIQPAAPDSLETQKDEPGENVAKVSKPDKKFASEEGLIALSSSSSMPIPKEEQDLNTDGVGKTSSELASKAALDQRSSSLKLVQAPASISRAQTQANPKLVEAATKIHTSPSAPVGDYMTRSQSLPMKELKKKHHFKNMREKVQRFFGMRQASGVSLRRLKS